MTQSAQAHRWRLTKKWWEIVSYPFLSVRPLICGGGSFVGAVAQLAPGLTSGAAFRGTIHASCQLHSS